MSSRNMILSNTKQAKIHRRVKQTNAAEVVASLDELLIQLLLCLPATSLMRFKLVCKRWKNLITSPYFVLQYRPDPNPAVGLFYPLYGSSDLIYIDYNARRTRTQAIPPIRKLYFSGISMQYWIGRSCNGLLVCYRYGIYAFREARSPINMLYTCNPTTKKFTEIPLSHHLTSGHVYGIHLAYDGANSASYKLVAVISSCNDDFPHQIEIYSSESGRWTVSGEPFSADVSFKQGVYCNGAIHWIATTSIDLWRFNVDEENLQVMKTDRDCTNWKKVYFGESCGHLYLIERYGNASTLSVYEMSEDYSCWSLIHEVDLSICASEYPDMSVVNDEDETENEFTIYSFVRGNNVEDDSFIIMQIESKIIRFNLGPKTLEELYDFSGIGMNHLYDTSENLAFEYIESLASF